MTKMSKILTFLTCLFCLAACRENQPDSVTELFESSAILQIHRVGTEPDEVDFDRELELCESDEVFSAAAQSLGLTAGDVRHLELKALREANQIEVTVGHTDAETARALASAIASSYMTARGNREKQIAAERLNALDAELEAEERDLKEQMAASEVLLNGAGEDRETPSFDQDRMTYQKAKAAMFEVPIEEQEQVVKKLRDRLATMIGNHFVEKNGTMVWVPNPPFTKEEYDSAKLAYEEAWDALKKLKAE